MLSNNEQLGYASLPAEILLKIFSYLYIEDMHPVSLINHLAYSIVMDKWFRLHVEHHFPRDVMKLSQTHEDEINWEFKIDWHAQAWLAHNTAYTTHPGFFGGQRWTERNKLLFPLVKTGNLQALKKATLKLLDLQRCDSYGVMLVEYAKEYPPLLEYCCDLVNAYYSNHETDAQGRSILHWHILLGKVDTLKEYILKKNYTVDVKDCSRKTLLHYAAFTGQENIFKFLKDSKLIDIDDINARDILGATPLCMAVQKGHKKFVDILLLNNANANLALQMDDSYSFQAFKFLKNDAPIHLAVKVGRDDIVEALLNHGIEVNSLALGRYTPLHYAACNGEVKVAQLLIQRGADINARSTLVGITPLLCATYWQHKKIVDILLKCGANTSLALLMDHGVSKKCDKALHIAVKKGNKEIVETLLDHGVEVNSVCMEKYTALHYAAIRKQGSEMAKLLIQRGANIDARSSKLGVTPLLCAIMNGHKETVSILLENNAGLAFTLQKGHKKYSEGDDALHLAVKAGDSDIVEALLDQGANIEVKNAEGKSALIVSLDYEQEGIAKLLIERGAFTDKNNQRLRPFILFSFPLQSSWHFFKTGRVNDAQEVEMTTFRMVREKK